MASKVKYTPSEAGSVGLGQAGSKFITASGAVTPSAGVFVALTVVDTVKFTTLTPEDTYFPDETNIGITTEIPIGITLYGRWTSLEISQGKLIGYNG